MDADFGQGKNKKGIIFVHGIANERYGEEPFIQAAEKLTKLGYSTLLFDLRAHGKSSGESVNDYTISSQLIDITAAIQFLHKHGSKTIYLAGASFGGGAACLYTKENPDSIKALLLNNPVLNYNASLMRWIETYGATNEALSQQGFVEIGSKKYKLGKKLFDEMQEYYPLQALHAFHKPLLILHGDNDAIIAYEESVAGFEQLPNPHKKLTLIPGANHGFHEEPFTSQVADIIVDFFNSL